VASCLVLGANGFIGSHIVDALAEKGHTVKAFGRHSKKVVYKDYKNVQTIHGDFLNRSDTRHALAGVDYLFHFISTTTPITADSDPQIDIETNIHRTVELLGEAIEQGVKKVVFASTSSIYGATYNKPCTEDDVPLPVSPYAIGKLTIEHYLRYFKVKYGLDSVTFRISNPYGERQALNSKQGVIPIFMGRVYHNKPVTVLGDGTMARDYIYVEDAVSMITSVFDKRNQHDVYNIGSGKSISVNEIIENIQSVSGTPVKKKYESAPPTFVHTVSLDTSRFTNEFGLRPTTDLEVGMKATWRYVTDQYEGLHA